MNTNKVICCDGNKMSVIYTDTNKHFVYNYNKQSVVKTTTEHVVKNFNSEQQRIFRQALHGLSLYNEKSLKKMSFAEKNRISNMHSKTIDLLHKWKQELADNIVDTILLSFFPNSKITKRFLDVSGNKELNIITAKFKDLGINQYQIAEHLVKNNCLPSNFFQLC